MEDVAAITIDMTDHANHLELMLKKGYTNQQFVTASAKGAYIVV